MGVDNYWLYHKAIVEEPDDERMQPADKAWLIVKYLNNVKHSLAKVTILDVKRFL